MAQDFTPLTDDCHGLGFSGRFADIAALNAGDPAELRPVMDEPTRRRLLRADPRERTVALVIGGNGFVGAHLVARLSREPGIEKVIATARANADGTPRQRFEETVALYNVGGVNGDKIHFLDADPTRPMFGLPADHYHQLAERVDLIFNSASSSDYATSYIDLRADWVGSLLRILQFAMDTKPKHVTYMGSLSASLYRSPADFRRPDSWWYSGYAQMKWVNGELLRWLGREGVLPVTLCESPYVLGATDVGLDPGLHYSWWRVVEIAKSIGVIWRGPGMNYLPVDVLADVLTVNAMSDTPMPSVVPCNTESYSNELLAALLGLDVVDWDDFTAEAHRLIPNRHLGTLLSSNIDSLIRIANRTPPLLPDGYDTEWCDNLRLHVLYLRNISFHDLARRRRFANTARSA